MGGLIYRRFGVLQPILQSQVKRSKKAERSASQRSLPVHFSEKYNVARRGIFFLSQEKHFWPSMTSATSLNEVMQALAELQALRDITLTGRELLARSFADDASVQHHEMLEIEAGLLAAMKAARDATGSEHIEPFGSRPPSYAHNYDLRVRQAEMKAKPVAAVTEIKDLGLQASILFGELRQRSSCLQIDVTRHDHGVGYALNVPDSLSLHQLRAISESADARRDSHRGAVRDALHERLEPREELEELLWFKDLDPADQDPLYDASHVRNMVTSARNKLCDMLGSPLTRLKRLKAVDVDALPALLEVAERFAGAFTPDGFVGYDESAAAYARAIAEGREAEANDDAWSLYDGGESEEHVRLKKAIAAAHERVAMASIAYDEGEGESARRAEREAAGLPADLPWERPAKHECPLTCDRMLDPVVAADGMTYERTAILEWFFKGHLTSPMTRRDLASDELTPNLALKALIRDWLKDEHEKIMKVARMAPARALAAAAAEGRKRGRDE